MRRLILLRHAKSSWRDASLADFSRPLSPRGLDAAPRIGRFLARCMPDPGAMLCSSARRTLETWTLISRFFPDRVTMQPRNDIYMASRDDLLRIVQALPPGAEDAIVIGHNPGLEDFADALCGSGPNADLRRLRGKFPTSAFADIELKVPDWSDVEPGCGKLLRFMRVKDLD